MTFHKTSQYPNQADKDLKTRAAKHFPYAQLEHKSENASDVYQLLVVTGHLEQAGTSANVFVTLFGEQTNSGERLLRNAENNFMRGGVDLFWLETQTLGRLRQVRIRHDNHGGSPSWFLVGVVVSSLDMETIFPCSRWLAYDRDENSIDRVLYCL